ncbi:MAG: lysylphosphatidylglycerol synthase transmembrane domain-containing protein [Burkholderiaceae bacterium]
MSDMGAVLTPSRRWTLAAVVAIYIGVTALVLSRIDTGTLEQAWSLPWWLVAGMLGLSLINYLLRAWRWEMLSRTLSLHVPVLSNALYYFSGYALTATPGKAGEAIRLWFLKSGHGIGYSRSLPLMLADRALDVWAVTLLTLVSFSGFQAYRWHGVALVVMVVLVSLPLLRPRLFEPVLLWCAGWLRGRRRLLVRVRRMVRAMARLSSWKTYGYTLLPSVLGWWAEAAALYVILRHFGADLTLANAVFVFAFGMIVGAISMLPGGLGGTEATMILLLKALGVPLDVALLSTALVRATTFWFAVALGLALTPSAIAASRRAAVSAGVPAVGRAI